MITKKCYDFDWAVANIFKNEGVIFERKIDYIFFYMLGFDTSMEIFGERWPERGFFNKFWVWMIDNIGDYNPKSMYWYYYFREKSSKTKTDEDVLFYDEYLRFIENAKFDSVELMFNDDLYSEFQDIVIGSLFLANRRPERSIKEIMVSYIYYIFLGEATFLEKNCNVPIESNIAFKFGKWLNKKYPEYDENIIGLFWYLIIEDLSKQQNIDELNLLVELFTEFLQVSENRNVVFDKKTQKLYEYNFDGSVKNTF